MYLFLYMPRLCYCREVARSHQHAPVRAHRTLTYTMYIAWRMLFMMMIYIAGPHRHAEKCKVGTLTPCYNKERTERGPRKHNHAEIISHYLDHYHYLSYYY